ncbi:hypothetical protein IQ266_01785 [filamentous cyanobacterium LEGE 11480]|uniref:Uncharacterized protein n=1 Tax=Romeriopsis navalis LEGE 11480 TaxID=2777977 RepID=A0A928Z0P6_9CYAN|nr:hypothetical protein [Romeriopsis navalis]MBE9028486.1 hypothetical protein [Romeriopsis navalis LEGE 11480]
MPNWVGKKLRFRFGWLLLTIVLGVEPIGVQAASPTIDPAVPNTAVPPAPAVVRPTAEPEHGQSGIDLPQVVILEQPQVKIDIQQFRRGQCANGTRGTSERSINLAGTTIPSLWWTRDLVLAKKQFNPKLIEGWLVCAAGVQNAEARVCAISPVRPGRVEMLVNTQLWTVLDYLSRYEFLYRFGSATTECGYNIHIFNTDAVLMADYICDYQSDRPNHDCRLRPDLSGRSGLKRGPTDVFSATDYRIELR